MEDLCQMIIEAVNKYLSLDVRMPFFLVVGDGQYKKVKSHLQEMGLCFVKVSDYCSQDDKLPSLDKLIETLKTVDKNVNDKRLVVVGLGEYLALRGQSIATKVINQLKNLNIGNAKVVLLLRGIPSQVKDLQEDPRFDSRRFTFSKYTNCILSFTIVNPSICLPAIDGFKALLMNLEDGKQSNIYVKTAVNLDDSLFTIYKITNAYEGIRHIDGNFNLPQSCGNEEQWAELLKEIIQNDNQIDRVFEYYGYAKNLEENLYSRINVPQFKNWLYYIALKIKADTLTNSYLRFVLDYTITFKDLKKNILNAIIEVPPKNESFSTFYLERKKLVAKFPESDIADFVYNNRKNQRESIYMLTDNTVTECEEIIVWVSKYGYDPFIAEIYPALANYLKHYVFNCEDLSDLLTEYFDEYKQQKVANKLNSSFIEKVVNFAKKRVYNRLPTRNKELDKLNKEGAFLYWLDSLGVEYLAYITELASLCGLSISVSIARANLPTITEMNKDFFDAWPAAHKKKNEELDNIKHKDISRHNFENNKYPIHLARELKIIADVIDEAATMLAGRRCKKFLIVSDHGSSRLAVLHRKEEKYDTDTKGRNSGRFCELFEPYDLPFAAEENGYLVLADYGRFKGSRAANVEVHGGASLEEVIVPIIELKLKDSTITVEMVEDNVTVDYRAGTAITLFFNFPVRNVSVIINKKRYLAQGLYDNHYRVLLPDIKRAGTYSAEVYAGDDLIGRIQIKAQGKSATVNDAFDNLF